MLFDRGRRGPALKDFDICGDRDRFGSVATLQVARDRLAGCSSWPLRFAVYSSGGNLEGGKDPVLCLIRHKPESLPPSYCALVRGNLSRDGELPDFEDNAVGGLSERASDRGVE